MSRASTLLARVRPHVSNASWSSAEYLFYPFLMLLATPVLVSRLGTGSYGILMFVNAVAATGGAANLGMGAATVKFVSACLGQGDRHGAANAVRSTLFMALIGVLPVAGAITAAAFVGGLFQRMGDPTQVRTALLFASAILLFMQVDGVFASALRGMERFGTAARLEIVFKLAAVTGSMGAAVLFRSLTPVLAVSTAALAMSGIAKGIAASRSLGAGLLVPRLGERSMTRAVLGFGLWNWVSGIGSLLFVHADRLLIGSLLGAQPLAYYTVCVQLAQQVHALPAAAMSFLFPLISRKAQAGDTANFRAVRNYGVAANLVLSFALGAGMFTLGPEALKLWMGADFAARSGDILLWLTAAFLVLSVNVAPYFLLLGQNEARYVSVTSLTGGGIGVVMALALIPPFGLVGAAAARLMLGITATANYWKLYVSPPLQEARSGSKATATVLTGTGT